MICEMAMELMSAELDGELSEQERQELNAHLNRCEDCRRLHEAMASIDEKVSALAEPAPAGLKQGVMYRIDQESGKIKPTKRRFFGVGTGLGVVAAVLVLLVGIGVIPLPEQSKDATRSTGGEINSIAIPASPLPAGTVGLQEADSADTEPRFTDGFKGFSGLLAETGAAEVDPISDSEYEAWSQENVTGYGYGNGFGLAILDDAMHEDCARLAAQQDAPVLFYSDFSYNSLQAFLKQEAPALADRLADSECSEADGLLCCRTNWETALALHEWLLAVCPGSNTDRDGKLTEKMEVLDPDGDTLRRVISFREDSPAELAADLFPDAWPDGWADRLLQAESWALVFPAEDFVPHAEDEALLLFPAEP